MRRTLWASALGVAFAAPCAVWAHGLNVFASTDCETVLVEAKFSNGRAVQKADVEIRGGDNQLLTTVAVADGKAELPLADLDHSGGLLIMIDTDGHDDFWILTPEDIARKCGS
jgi:nickel transport protein